MAAACVLEADVTLVDADLIDVATQAWLAYGKILRIVFRMR